MVEQLNCERTRIRSEHVLLPLYFYVPCYFFIAQSVGDAEAWATAIQEQRDLLWLYVVLLSPQGRCDVGVFLFEGLDEGKEFVAELLRCNGHVT